MLLGFFSAFLSSMLELLLLLLHPLTSTKSVDISSNTYQSANDLASKICFLLPCVHSFVIVIQFDAGLIFFPYFFSSQAGLISLAYIMKIQMRDCMGGREIHLQYQRVRL